MIGFNNTIAGQRYWNTIVAPSAIHQLNNWLGFKTRSVIVEYIELDMLASTLAGFHTES